MKIPILALVGAIGVGASSLGCFAACDAAADAEQIRALEQAGAQTNVSGQTLADAEQLFAQEFVSVGKDGKINTPAELLTHYEGGRSEPWASRFDLKELSIKTYCDAATVVGLAEAVPINAAAAMPALHFRFLNEWTRSDGVWRLSAAQFTTF